MGERVRAFDWSQTPVGAVDGWPRSLRTAVRILLGSRYPMFVWWGPELTNIYNDAYAPMLGARHPWALGRPAPEIWADVWPVVGPQTELVLDEGQSTWNESVLLMMERHGYLEEAYFTFSYSPAPDDDGGVGGVFAAVTEDTRRVFGERQLELLRALGAETADARNWQEACRQSARALGQNPYDLPFAVIWVADPDGSQLSLVAASGFDGVDPPLPAVVSLAAGEHAPFAAALAAREPVVVENLAAFAAGSLPTGAWDEPPTSAALVPVAASGETGARGVLLVGLNPFRRFDDGYRNFLTLVAGQVAAAIANAQAYEEEQKRAEALAELDRVKTAFFSNVSHEFRTPLTLILGPVEDLLARLDAGDGALKAELEVVQRNSHRLLRLVNTMLDFSRIEAGRLHASYEPVDLPVYTAELASVFRAAIERAGLQLAIDCRPLPQPVYVDRELWEKIVLNLLSNALKFTFEGEIEVRLEARQGEALLTVRDSGVGIPPAELPRVFERFHRVEHARGRTHEGTGIGLALVQELVELHGGRVRAESAVGEGSRFLVSIPFGTAHLDPARIGAPREIGSTATGAAAYTEEALLWLAGDAVRQPALVEGAAPPPPPRDDRGAEPRPRVVWADDNADMRGYVARLLGDDFDVEPVVDGEAALAAVRRAPPDLVLADVMMPRLDGLALVRELRADPQLEAVPVVLISARAGEEARIEGMHVGADDYLIKPFSARELLARVDAHVRIARLRRATLERERRVDAALRASAERRAFVVGLGAAVRDVRDPREIMRLAAEHLGRHLAVDRVGYGEPDATGASLEIAGDWTVPGMPSIAGSRRLDDFGAVVDEFRAGRAVVIEDALDADATAPGETVAASPQTVECRAGIAMPLVRDGSVIAVLLVHAREPRRWSDEEVELVRDVAERTAEAVERARAHRDRDDLLRREQAVRLDAERAAHAATAFAFVSIGVALTDPSGVVRSWNVAAERITGMTADRIVGRQLAAALPGWAEIAARVPLAATGAYEPLPFTTAPLRRGERELWLSVAATSFDGGVVYTFADVTGERALERIRSDLIATVSHELRTPLAAVYGAALTLKRDDLDLDRHGRRQFLDMIETQARRLATLVDEVLLASRLESGEVTVAPVLSDPLQLAREIVDAARTATAGADISLAAPLAPLPPVSVDADKVQQVLRNLVENAVRYSDGTPTVEVEVEGDGRRLRFRVTDHGIGIATEEQERIFEKFYRVDPGMSDRGAGGTGLGLYISRELARRMNGRLSVESRPGQGSVFTLELQAEPL